MPDHKKNGEEADRRWPWIVAALLVYAVAGYVVARIAFGLTIDDAIADGAIMPNGAAAFVALINVAVMWVSAATALWLCWRRRRLMRVAVLGFPLLTPLAYALFAMAPSFSTFLLWLLAGIVGVAVLAGSDRRDRSTIGRPPD